MARKNIKPHIPKIIPIRPNVCVEEAEAEQAAYRMMGKYELIQRLRIKAELEGNQVGIEVGREMAAEAQAEWLAALTEAVRIRTAKNLRVN